MKRCDIVSDNLFLTNNDEDYVKTEKYGDVRDVAVYLRTHLFDPKTNENVYRDADNEKDMQDQITLLDGTIVYVSNFFRCYYDPKAKNGYRILANLSYHKRSPLVVTYSLGEHWMWDKDGEPHRIDHQTLIDILKSHPEAFDNSDNKPAQGTAYYTVPIETQGEPL